MATTTNGIYYPNDYNAAADIPADLKKVAESIDKNVQDNKYNDTEIKQDITELQSKNEEQDEKIETIEAEQELQNDLLQRTQSALINITTEKSSNINVKDSSDLNAKVDVFGISEQETREGYNKFDYDTIEGLAGSTIKTSVDGLNVYKRTSSNQNIWPLFNLNDVLEDGKAYTMCFDIWADAQTSFNNQRFYVNTTTKTTHNLSNITTAKQRLIANFTYTKNDSNAIIHIYPTTSETNNFYIANVMLLEETFTSENIPEFEQYGASPSPEFPSEIEDVTGNIDITVCNKNLFGGKVANVATDGEKTVVASNYVSAFIKSVSGKSYSISKKVQTSRFRVAFSKEPPNINAVPLYGGYMGTEFDNKLKIENMVAPAETNYMLVYVSNSSENINGIGLQIEENNSSTDYLAHEEQLITFPLQEGQRLYNGDYLASDGIHHIKKQKEFDGTEPFYTQTQVVNNIFYTALLIDDMKQLLKDNLLSSHFKGILNPLNNVGISGSYANYLYFGIEVETIGALPTQTEAEKKELFKTWLAQQKQAGTPVIVEYELAEETVEAYTEAQQEAYNKLQNVLSYYNVTNVFTDKAQLVFKYIADTKTYVDNQYNALANQVLELAGGN